MLALTEASNDGAAEGAVNQLFIAKNPIRIAAGRAPEGLAAALQTAGRPPIAAVSLDECRSWKDGASPYELARSVVFLF